MVAHSVRRQTSKTRPRSDQPDALFRAAADQAPQVMWIVNAQGAVTYLNHAWYELVGGMPPKWYGHEWGEVVHPDDLAEMRTQWQAVGRVGATFEGRRRVRSRDGSWHTLSYRATPVFDSHGLACWVGMDSDITELVATHSALKAANEELQSFSHTVAHDLKAPLLTLKGFTQLLGKLLARDTDPRVNHYLGRITQAVEHTGLLLDGLQVLAQVSRRPMRFEDVDLSEIGRQVTEALVRAHPEREVSVIVQPGLSARADTRLIAVLLENLLGNAWKFTAKVPAARISLGLAQHSGTATTFFVKDNGAGFDAGAALKLFQPFQRFHRADEFPGTGIGLATVSRVAERHGGRVWVDSAPGEGACFYFTLNAPA
jgi:PAS domain S-box-containing protein